MWKFRTIYIPGRHGHVIKFCPRGFKWKGCVQLLGDILKGKEFALPFDFFFPTSSNAVLMAVDQATILDHEEEPARAGSQAQESRLLKFKNSTN